MRLRPRLVINPIVVKELRSRMRGARAFAALTGALLLLAAVSYSLYRIILLTSTYSYSSTPLSPQIGQTLFVGLAFLELLLVCFITPAVTAGAISGEREKLTYEMLVATPLRPVSILWGKLIAALSYVLLLILAAIPMASLAFTFGGIAPHDMLKVLVILIAVAITLGTLGIFMSTVLERTGRATVLSYLVVLGLLVGPLFIYLLVGILRQQEPPRWILVPSPASALFSALTPATPDTGLTGFVWGLGMAIGGNLGMLQGVPSGLPRPLYHYTLALYAALTLVLYLMAAWLVQPVRRWRPRWREVLVALALLLGFGGAVALAFSATAGRYQQISPVATPTPMPVMIEPVIVSEAVPLVPTPAPTPTQPSPAASPTSDPASVLSQNDQAGIYAAVVRQLYSVDHTLHEQAPNFPVVYLVRITDDSLGDPQAPRAESHQLPEALQTAIVALLDDLPARFIWVDSRDQVPMDAYSRVEDGGVIFTLGNIHPQPGGSARVSAGLYFGSLRAGGNTYILGIMDGAWQIMGTTGVEWTG